MKSYLADQSPANEISRVLKIIQTHALHDSPCIFYQVASIKFLYTIQESEILNFFIFKAVKNIVFNILNPILF